MSQHGTQVRRLSVSRFPAHELRLSLGRGSDQSGSPRISLFRCEGRSSTNSGPGTRGEGRRLAIQPSSRSIRLCRPVGYQYGAHTGVCRTGWRGSVPAILSRRTPIAIPSPMRCWWRISRALPIPLRVGSAYFIAKRQGSCGARRRHAFGAEEIHARGFAPRRQSRAGDLRRKRRHHRPAWPFGRRFPERPRRCSAGQRPYERGGRSCCQAGGGGILRE